MSGVRDWFIRPDNRPLRFVVDPEKGTVREVKLDEGQTSITSNRDEIPLGPEPATPTYDGAIKVDVTIRVVVEE